MQKNTIHKLKSWPHFFQDMQDGLKNFELRKNDRPFRVGDELLLEEYAPDDYFKEAQAAHYTGRILHRKIVYKMRGGEFGLEKDYVILGLEKI